ncbi:alginate lyase family protein [Sphingobacterium puteale]|nr:alginate lyase family protein [Sphingobacterium puteale]
MDFGKLWNYNLEYFDYLQQNDISTNEKERLIEDFYKFSISKKRKLEPYPVSLRSINIIRFVLDSNRLNADFLKFVCQELDYLSKNYEYHILGNHLLENAFALCLGGAFFNNKNWHAKAVKILQNQLSEQILKDGGHFELSPMYHQIIFYRTLELLDWYENYPKKDKKFEFFLRKIAEGMKSWLIEISFENGDIPLFNDAANGIAMKTEDLLAYATRCGVNTVDIALGESGYRTYKGKNYEIKVDVGPIGADYQPGHAHADSLSFILYSNRQPLLVEQGTSTYQIGFRRDLERSTSAHNTIVVAGKNQSEVWGGFRVGARANTTVLAETENKLVASHDGYRKLNLAHKRSFGFKDDRIEIEDFLSSEAEATAFFHLHPTRTVEKFDASTYIIDGRIKVVMVGAHDIKLEEYKFADQYNNYHIAKRLVASFSKSLNTSIHF